MSQWPTATTAFTIALTAASPTVTSAGGCSSAGLVCQTIDNAAWSPDWASVRNWSVPTRFAEPWSWV